MGNKILIDEDELRAVLHEAVSRAVTDMKLAESDTAGTVLLYGDELAEGMEVLYADKLLRKGYGPYGEGFCKVSKIRTRPAAGLFPAQVQFVGTWPDGHQQFISGAATNGWLVKDAKR